MAFAPQSSYFYITAARLSTACNRVRERLATKPANLDALVAKLAAAVVNTRAYLMLYLKHRSEALQVSQPFAHLFRQM